MPTNSEKNGASATGWNVYRGTGEAQGLVGSAETYEAARRLAQHGDQIQRGLDGEVENVVARAPGDAGRLMDYKTGRTLRSATAEEHAESIAAAARDGGSGVITVDGRSCYVES